MTLFRFPTRIFSFERVTGYLMKISKNCFLTVLFFALATLSVHASADVDAHKNQPPLFINRKEAIQNNCHPISLKGNHQKSCFVQGDGSSQHKTITLYDENEAGQYVRSEDVCIPSWYGKAKAAA